MKERNNVGGLIVALLFTCIFVMAVIILLMATENDVPAGLVLAGGLLKSPFDTTRRMKVDWHSRKGHRERAFESFVRIVLMTATILTLLLWLWAQRH